ncbi:hypothetical protein [Salinarimonas ramus]|uniref:Uncharacterized protein n=1 Tax=Salinarimonas ramus TaxID=690164 RepID=A0A917Q4E9_9HYPH|nr:hypothetical protein [Salinarimonas ramus]GGK20167.1 hypothetical protein GCM10011322_03570 [Salinarimonas ramus]
MNARMHIAGEPPSAGQVFNLFRRLGSDLVCAVPLDRPVPLFLDGRWEHVCEADAATRLAGFGYRSACTRAGRHGFALFRTRCEPLLGRPEAVAGL